METKEKFLSFNLGVMDTAVISLQHIIEVLQVPLPEICGVPQMHSSILGIYNWRGEMLWLVDLQAMLGYPPISQESNLVSRMMAIVLENKGKYLGLLVRQLLDIEWLDTKQMKSATTELFYPKISPFLQGYFINDSEEMIFNLDAITIIQAPIWDIHN
ncbi:MAG: chemotaxis protein CheW [Nostoc sp. NMS7]|uniref:chemotaxis protein CheW n=1 Tax=Nostoc sp. NMS7 TaxID=2815391 RepID=UPI0025F94942|nr:chemotaxis protein CheW [Nostoc sp. NMS7]MBN3950428.1 chemotaxis protein CheW [Nostoc sp. NMS7]